MDPPESSRHRCLRDEFFFTSGWLAAVCLFACLLCLSYLHTILLLLYYCCQTTPILEKERTTHRRARSAKRFCLELSICLTTRHRRATRILWGGFRVSWMGMCGHHRSPSRREIVSSLAYQGNQVKSSIFRDPTPYRAKSRDLRMF